MFEIRFSAGVAADLKRLRAGQRRRVLDEIEKKLSFGPMLPTKHVKRLKDLVLPFEAVPPVWQLRIGEFRVIYDVDEVQRQVFVRAVRRKPPHRTTEEIL